MTKPLTLIVAAAENRVIGRAGELAFDVPEDKTWFHEKTANATLVLGRVSFERWPRVTADGRQPIVVTTQPELVRLAAGRKSNAGSSATTPLIATDVPTALALAQTLPDEIMVCGGQRIYEETLPLADRLLLTLVHAVLPGDTYFPEWRHGGWRETWRREGQDANYRYTFFLLERSRPGLSD